MNEKIVNLIKSVNVKANSMIAVGIGIGVAIGISIGNFPIGIAAGTALGVAMRQKNLDTRNDNDS